MNGLRANALRSAKCGLALGIEKKITINLVTTLENVVTSMAPQDLYNVRPIQLVHLRFVLPLMLSVALSFRFLLYLIEFIPLTFRL